MGPLLSDVRFAEQLLRTYLESKHQEMFGLSTCSLSPFDGPCALVARDDHGRPLWLELTITPTTPVAIFVALYELGGHPSSLSLIVSINVSNPNGQNTMKEIVEDKLCELSTTYRNRNSLNFF